MRGLYILDPSEIYHIGKDEVLMEALEGGTVETVHSIGMGLWKGTQGNMKRIRVFGSAEQVLEYEILEYILKKYKAICDSHDWDYEINYVSDINTINEVNHMLDVINK